MARSEPRRSASIARRRIVRRADQMIADLDLLIQLEGDDESGSLSALVIELGGLANSLDEEGDHGK